MLVSHPIACKAALIVVGTVMQVYDGEDFRVAVKRRTLTMVFTMVIPLHIVGELNSIKCSADSIFP
jgi:hypothetical protein